MIDLLVDDFLDVLQRQSQELPFLYSAAAPNGDCYGIGWDGTSVQLMTRVAGAYTLLGSTGGEEILSIEGLLGLELDVSGSTMTIRVRGRPILVATDSSLAGTATHFTRRFERAPDPTSVEVLRTAAAALLAKREDAFFGTVSYRREDALAAVCLMESAFEASKVFIPRVAA